MEKETLKLSREEIQGRIIAEYSKLIKENEGLETYIELLERELAVQDKVIARLQEEIEVLQVENAELEVDLEDLLADDEETTDIEVEIDEKELMEVMELMGVSNPIEVLLNVLGVIEEE